MCLSEPGAVLNLISIGSDVDEITITWTEPSFRNGTITMYDIRYRESDFSGSFIFVNGTTKTEFTIDELIPNTYYTFGVRAYTIAGPGEWTDKAAMTLDIRKNFQ